MKVLSLRCAHDHRFEGWFASDADFMSQRERSLVACPMCDDTTIGQLPSAPRLNVSKQRHARAAEVATGNEGGESVAMGAQVRMQAQWLRAVRQVLSNTEDVGDRFPEEARRIHYGETQERGIRGRASREDAEMLRDEGIEVVALPLPESMKGPVQ
jgi:hypothetical protein